MGAEQTVLQAITLKSSDFGDYDKIVSLYTPGAGIISVKLKGVKKADAKLKFCVRPFSFCEYVLTGRGDVMTVIGAESLETFFELSDDLDKFSAASAIAETILQSGDGGGLFVTVLRALGAMLTARPREVLLKYLFDFLAAHGYRFSFGACGRCGVPHFAGQNFDAEYGLVCSACAAAGKVRRVSGVMLSGLRLLSETEYSRLSTLRLNQNALEQGIALAAELILDNIGIALKSLKLL